MNDSSPSPIKPLIIMWVVRWVFTNGHVWTKTFFSHEDAINWAEYCELTTDPNIIEWSINEEISDL